MLSTLPTTSQLLEDIEEQSREIQPLMVRHGDKGRLPVAVGCGTKFKRQISSFYVDIQAQEIYDCHRNELLPCHKQC